MTYDDKSDDARREDTDRERMEHIVWHLGKLIDVRFKVCALAAAGGSTSMANIDVSLAEDGLIDALLADAAARSTKGRDSFESAKLTAGEFNEL